MKIVIIGTGNVATVLGRKFKQAGHVILQVCGRSKEAVIGLTKEWNATAVMDWASITRDADLYLIALSDTALTDIEKNIRLTDQLVVHTAGSVSLNVLEKVSSSFGVFYPFQTLRKEISSIPEIPVFIDANSEKAKEILKQVALTISGQVTEANDKQRMQYHLSAILVNNFSNYFYALAEGYCKNHGLEFNKLLPLIRETADRLQHISPRLAQTGPAIRKDIATIEKHRKMLESDPALQALYSFVSGQILQFKWGN